MSNKTCGVKNIVNEFLRIAKENNQTLTNLQLQKLVYIAHGYYLAIYNKPLFYQEAMAWHFGPVIKELYNSLKKYGKEEVTEELETENIPINDEAKELIKTVYSKYKDLTVSQLSGITHAENTPWRKAWDNEKFSVINNEIIKEYYGKIING